MKTETKSWLFTGIVTGLLAAFVVAPITAALYAADKQRQEATPPEMIATSFVIESGPETVGSCRIYVIRHRETSRRFLLTQEYRRHAIVPID